MGFDKFVLVLLFGLFICLDTYGNDYYCDPGKGSMNNPGTFSLPWSSLEDVFKSDKSFMPGDIIYLMTGYHGFPTISGSNLDYVVIKPFQTQKPVLKSIILSSAKRWKLSGLTISPETAPVYSKQTLLSISSSSSQNIIDSCFIYSVLNISAWTENDWLDKACNGISISGVKNTVRKTLLRNLNFALQVTGDSCLAENNVIENFMSDGIRGLGDYCTFQYNRIANCFKINDNHDDGFQSWSVGSGGVGTGTVYGVVLRGNLFISYSDPAQSFKANLQGIGCFDGMFRDWIVENNVVITDMWHGISLYGAVNCRIINNTVVKNPINAFNLTPWIGIYNHKEGTPSSGNIIRNNIASSYSTMSGSISDHNITTTQYDNFFLDYNGFDLHLKKGCPAIDAGSLDGAPGMDIEKNPRPSGSIVDIGAYEFIASTGIENFELNVNPLQLKVYPVPFSTVATINFILDKESDVEFSVYDPGGKLIKKVLKGVYPAGKYSFDWNTSDISGGIYFCELITGYVSIRAKIIKVN